MHWFPWWLQVPTLNELREPGRYTPSKSGRIKYTFTYPLHTRFDAAVPEVLRGEVCSNNHSSAISRSSTLPTSLLSHDQRREVHQQMQDMAEVRALS